MTISHLRKKQKKFIKLLIFDRGPRFQKIITNLVKCLPNNWKVIFYSSIKVPSKYQLKNKNLPSACEATGNYIYYYDYIRQQGLEPKIFKTKKEIISIYKKEVLKIKYVLSKIKPNLCFCETIDTPESYLANYFLGKNKLPILLEARMNGLGPWKIIPCYGLNRKNVILELKNQKPLDPSKKSIIEAKKLFYHAQKKDWQPFYDKWHKNETKISIPKIFNELQKCFFSWKYLKYIFKFRLKFVKSFLLDRHLFRKNLKNMKSFIVFFFNHLPEASTFSEAPEFSDISNIVLRLARYQPNNVSILCKEHPRSLFRRPEGFYKRLSKLPGVNLLHPSFDNLTLFKKAKSILVINGTPGLQAGLFHASVGCLGRPAWSQAPWVTQIQKPEEVFFIPKVGPKKSKTSVRFLAKYLDASFDMEDRKNGFCYEESFGTAIARMLVSTYPILRGRKTSQTFR